MIRIFLAIGLVCVIGWYVFALIIGVIATCSGVKFDRPWFLLLVSPIFAPLLLLWSVVTTDGRRA